MKSTVDCERKCVIGNTWNGLAWFRREKLGTKPLARYSSSVTPILVYWQHLISERHVGQKEKRRLFLNLDSRDHGVWWPWILDIKGWVVYTCLPSNHAFNYILWIQVWVYWNSFEVRASKLLPLEIGQMYKSSRLPKILSSVFESQYSFWLSTGKSLRWRRLKKFNDEKLKSLLNIILAGGGQFLFQKSPLTFPCSLYKWVFFPLAHLLPHYRTQNMLQLRIEGKVYFVSTGCHFYIGLSLS